MLRIVLTGLSLLALYALYQSPQYRPKMQEIWEQVTWKLGKLEEEINRQIGYGGTSTLDPKSVGVTVPRSQSLDWQAVGTLGPDILSKNGRLILETDYTTSSAPSQNDVAILKDVLKKYTGKDVTLAGGSTDLTIQENYTLADVVELTRKNRSCYSKVGETCLYILFLPGKFESSSALGASFTSTAGAVFTDRLKEASSPLVSRDQVAQATLTHELGHLFGLVNLTGRGSGRDDPSHPGHSSNQRSVMYWAVEDLSVGSILRGGPPTTFDGDDEAEIQRIRGS